MSFGFWHFEGVAYFANKQNSIKNVLSQNLYLPEKNELWIPLTVIYYPLSPLFPEDLCLVLQFFGVYKKTRKTKYSFFGRSYTKVISRFYLLSVLGNKRNTSQTEHAYDNM